MFHRRPFGLSTIPAEKGLALARLNGLEGLSRSILVSVVPLIALQALGSKEAVAHVYLLAALFTLSITLNFNRLERLLERRWVVTMAAVFLCLAASFIYSGHQYLFALGVGFRASAASLFSVCLSLYIMDYVTRNQLALNESRRMVYAGGAWLIGPFLGSWLWGQELYYMPFILSICFATGMLLFFWRLRLGDNQIIRKNDQKPLKSVFKVVPRYFSQKRLRIAYFITLSRAIFWSSLFIYGPIYVVEAGLPAWAAGVLLSGVSGLLLFSQYIKKIADRFTTRRVITAGLVIAGIAQISLGILGEPAPLGVALWCFGALGGICLDVLGNIPFMKMVKPYERTDMTMVFSTWREMSELVTPLSITLITLLFPFWVFYIVLGLVLLTASVAATQLPRRL